jgi:hypothetical protein
MYSGEPKEAKAVAALITNDKSVRNVYVWTVDGIPPPPRSKRQHYGSAWDSSFRIEILPGKHTIIVGYLQESRVSRRIVNDKIITTTKLGPIPKAERHPVTFYAEAGKEYRLEGRYDITREIMHYQVAEVKE